MAFSFDTYCEKLQEFLTQMGLEKSSASEFARAFVHRSGLNEHKQYFEEHNERLEFLGDAVLELVISELLYKDFPDKPEGWLTDVRSSLVRGKHLGRIASELGFSEFMLVSRGEKASGGASNPSLLADAFEAFVGVLHQQSGCEAAQSFIRRYVYGNLDTILEEKDHVDPKSALQERTQAINGTIPEYVIVDETGMDHEKVFDVEVRFGGRKIGNGSGSSKKKAQEEAAADAMSNMSKWYQDPETPKNKVD